MLCDQRTDIINSQVCHYCIFERGANPCKNDQERKSWFLILPLSLEQELEMRLFKTYN